MCSGRIAVPSVACAEPKMVEAASRPWGNLQVDFLSLESADSLFYDHEERLKPTTWVVPASRFEEIEALLATMTLSETQKKELAKKDAWSSVANGWQFVPTAETISGLDPVSRGKLYEVLEKDARNLGQQLPFRFTPNTFKERFSVSSLSSNQLTVIRNLCYTNHGFLAFADLELVHRGWEKPAFEQLTRVLYSAPSLQLVLKLAPGTDIEPLVAYWGKNQRVSQIRSLLESVSKMPTGGEIDVLSLLPSFPKVHLYAFPDTSVDPLEARMDCFYSAMNFFTPVPDARFLNEAETKATIEANYVRLEEAPAFGDLVLLVNNKGVTIHVAVYIAENIVFTKNGASPYRPWCLMRIPEMLTYYPATPSHRIILLRHK
ncbi:MAG: hypothetical protein JWN25_2950 [Verrucomicrobiales bacterium]|nr:hypothetical protein [Verrucomicrobiales bacterium]